MFGHLDVLGVVEHLTRPTAIEACRPPHVPVPKPGPCPKAKTGIVHDAGKAVRKATAKPKGRRTNPAPPIPAKPVGRSIVSDVSLAKRMIADAEARPGVIRRRRHSILEDATRGDPMFSAVAQEQGFDAAVHTVSAAEFRAMQRDGTIAHTLYRGVQGHFGASSGRGMTAWAMMQEFRDGPVRGGLGTFGNGTYMAAARAHAKAYSDGTPDSLGTFGLRSDAKVVRWPELSDEFEAWYGKTFGLDASYTDLIERPEYEAYGDIGRWAAARGYDAIHVLKGEEPGFGEAAKGDQFVILNRGALIGQAPKEAKRGT